MPRYIQIKAEIHMNRKDKKNGGCRRVARDSLVGTGGKSAGRILKAGRTRASEAWMMKLEKLVEYGCSDVVLLKTSALSATYTRLQSTSSSDFRSCFTPTHRQNNIESTHKSTQQHQASQTSTMVRRKYRMRLELPLDCYANCVALNDFSSTVHATSHASNMCFCWAFYGRLHAMMTDLNTLKTLYDVIYTLWTLFRTNSRLLLIHQTRFATHLVHLHTRNVALATSICIEWDRGGYMKCWISSLVILSSIFDLLYPHGPRFFFFMQASAGEPFFVDVDALQEHGISAQDIAKLKASGVATVKGVQQCMLGRLKLLSVFYNCSYRIRWLITTSSPFPPILVICSPYPKCW